MTTLLVALDAHRLEICGNLSNHGKRIARHLHRLGENTPHPPPSVALETLEAIEARLLVRHGATDPSLQLQENVVHIGDVELLELGEGSLEIVGGSIAELGAGVEGGFSSGVGLNLSEGGGVSEGVVDVPNGGLHSRLNELFRVGAVVPLQAVETRFLVIRCLTDGRDGLLRRGHFRRLLFGAAVIAHDHNCHHHGHQKDGTYDDDCSFFLLIVAHIRSSPSDIFCFLRIS